MRIILALALIMPLSTFADCESIAQPSPATWYMRLIRKGLLLQELERKQLEELTQKTSPAEPEWDRGLGNLALRDGFRRVMPVLKEEHWPQVVRELEQELGIQKHNAEQVQIAVEQTRHIFAPLPTGHQLPARMHLPKIFVSRRGEIFVCGFTGIDSFLYNIRARTEHKIDGLDSNDTLVDFFETSSGQVVFAYVKDATVYLLDAQTYAPLMKKKFTVSSSSNFTPYIYESDSGNLKVVINNWGTKTTDGKGEQPIHTIDVKTKRISRKMVFGGSNLKFTRLANGHIYAIGFAQGHAFAYDTVAGKYHVKIATNRVDDRYGPVLLDGPEPKLIFYPYNNAPVEKWFYANPRSNEVVEFKNSPPPNLQTNFHLSDFSAWAPNSTYDNKLRIAQALMYPLDPEGSTSPVELRLEGVQNFRGSFRVLHRKQGDLLYVQERGEHGEVYRFYNLSLTEVGRIDFNFHHDNPFRPFVDPTDGRVFTFEANGGWDAPRVLYQLVGPEKLQ